MQNITYSFLDVKATLSGPSLVALMDSDTMLDEEAISLDFGDEVNTMTRGSGSAFMHTLIPNIQTEIKIKTLKTSLLNTLFQTAFNYQTGSSATHGMNLLTVVHVTRGDVITIRNVAFQKQPQLVYGAKGESIEWTFQGGVQSLVLGTGLPSLS
jgi:hypothetical protein